jgi:molecular chaperone DnaK
LLDVTPLSLSIETVGGFCETVIPRNAPIPCEQSRGFVTSQDGQTMVRLRVCQGESRRFAENQALGELLLEGLRPAPRGSVEIEVSFSVDGDGSIGVEAVDKATGISQRTRLERLGAIKQERIEELRAKHEAMARGAP